MAACVESIHIAPEHGAPTRAVDEAMAEPGFGLNGDRVAEHARAKGSAVPPKRQITLIETEAIEAVARDYGIPFTAAESRRNLCTRGAALNHLVGRTFTVGEVTLRGIELCEPCRGLERMTGKDVRPALVHRGGLRAEIVTGGTIRAGDAIAATE